MRFSILVTFIIGLSQFIFAQESIYFPSFETINVNTKHQYVASKLFKNYVFSNGKYNIILPSTLENNVFYKETIEETKHNALIQNTSYYMIADMSAIGNLLIINMKMYNTASSQLVWSDALKANELEDLDPVLKLLAKAIGTDENAVKSGDIYSVTHYDSKELNKRQASQSWGLSIGGGSLLASDASELGLTGFGILKSYDIRNLILDIKFEIYGSDGNNSTRIGMNVLKPMNDNNTSLFYGGGIYFGGIGYDQKYITVGYNGLPYKTTRRLSQTGLELEGSFGVILNRLSAIQLRATVTPIIALYKIDNKAIGALRFGITATF